MVLQSRSIFVKESSELEQQFLKKFIASCQSSCIMDQIREEKQMNHVKGNSMKAGTPFLQSRVGTMELKRSSLHGVSLSVTA